MHSRTLTTYAAAVALAFAACTDVLDEEVISGVTADSYLTSPEGADDVVRATYAPLRDFYGKELGFAVASVGTDIIMQGENNGNAVANFAFNSYDQRLNPRTNGVEELWNLYYRGINYANTAIARIEALEDVPAAFPREVRLAEARYLRAFYYFTLVQTYGKVHLTTEETTDAQTEANVTPAEQVYEQVIIPDLEFAIANLPATQPDYGRATKPAAQAILARVQLVRQDWAEAARLAKSVINDYSFKLAPTYAEIFDLENERNPEVVWAVQYTRDELINGDGNRAHAYWGPGYVRERGMTFGYEQLQTFKRYRPTAFFYGLFDFERDRRYEEGTREIFLATRNAAATPRAAALRVGDTAVVYTGRVVPQRVRDSILKTRGYFIYDRAGNTSDATPWATVMVNKFFDNTRPAVGDQRSSRDFLVVRVAEMYLAAAEAEMMLGNREAALALVNTLREARAKDGFEAEMRITAAQLDIDFLLDERGRELYAECLRWFDLKRTGKLLERARAHNRFAAPNIQDYHLVRPIPQQQIDLATYPQGVNPQNPGLFYN